MGQLLIIIHTTTHGYRREVLKALFKQIPNLIKGSLFKVPRKVGGAFLELRPASNSGYETRASIPRPFENRTPHLSQPLENPWRHPIMVPNVDRPEFFVPSSATFRLEDRIDVQVLSPLS